MIKQAHAWHLDDQPGCQEHVVKGRGLILNVPASLAMQMPGVAIGDRVYWSHGLYWVIGIESGGGSGGIGLVLRPEPGQEGNPIPVVLDGQGVPARVEAPPLVPSERTTSNWERIVDAFAQCERRSPTVRSEDMIAAQPLVPNANGDALPRVPMEVSQFYPPPLDGLTGKMAETLAQEAWLAEQLKRVTDGSGTEMPKSSKDPFAVFDGIDPGSCCRVYLHQLGKTEPLARVVGRDENGELWMYFVGSRRPVEVGDAQLVCRVESFEAVPQPPVRGEPGFVPFVLPTMTTRSGEMPGVGGDGQVQSGQQFDEVQPGRPWWWWFERAGMTTGPERAVYQVVRDGSKNIWVSHPHGGVKVQEFAGWVPIGPVVAVPDGTQAWQKIRDLETLLAGERLARKRDWVEREDKSHAVPADNSELRDLHQILSTAGYRESRPMSAQETEGLSGEEIAVLPPYRYSLAERMLNVLAELGEYRLRLCEARKQVEIYSEQVEALVANRGNLRANLEETRPVIENLVASLNWAMSEREANAKSCGIGCDPGACHHEGDVERLQRELTDLRNAMAKDRSEFERWDQRWTAARLELDKAGVPDWRPYTPEEQAATVSADGVTTDAGVMIPVAERIATLVAQRDKERKACAEAEVKIAALQVDLDKAKGDRGWKEVDRILSILEKAGGHATTGAPYWRVLSASEQLWELVADRDDLKAKLDEARTAIEEVVEKVTRAKEAREEQSYGIGCDSGAAIRPGDPRSLRTPDWDKLLTERPISKDKAPLDILDAKHWNGLPSIWQGQERVLDREALRDRVAAKAHEVWATWMHFQNSLVRLEPRPGGTCDAACIDKWERQAGTPYDQLPELDKLSDRVIASEYLELILGEQWREP
jgi:hypothetical protein